ncbi:MAG: nucleoside hydrolase [Chloroflexota bacterium]|nr:MAG: nucleoside hydrolase [Chloroflexota bacterium]
MTTRVILDTDIGTDVDDCLALSVILASPELQLDGVTCVYGDVALRARIVIELLALRGRDDVPVFLGARSPLLGKRPIYWAGHEGQGLLDGGRHRRHPADEHAVDYIVRHVMTNPGQIHLIAIGPLTNVALAFLREPGLAKALAHLTIMGGVLRGPSRLDTAYAEHNIKCDPEAAHIVLSSGAPMSLVPLDVTLRTVAREADLATIRARGDAYHHAVADQLARYPRFRDTGSTFLHDPLAVASVVRRDVLGWTRLRVDVELGGEHAIGATLMRSPTDAAPANAHVALDLDPARAERFIVERLAS